MYICSRRKPAEENITCFSAAQGKKGGGGGEGGGGGAGGKQHQQQEEKEEKIRTRRYAMHTVLKMNVDKPKAATVIESILNEVK